MTRCWRYTSIVLLLTSRALAAAEPAAVRTVPSPGLLLPVYAVDVAIDGSAVDGASHPSASAAHPHAGTSVAFQQLWSALRPSGFNAVRFTVDLREGQAAVLRVANLCTWAQTEKVGLIPVLVASPDAPLSKEFPDAAAAFTRGLAETLRGTDAAAAYARILMLQIGPDLNHPAHNGRLQMKEAAATLGDAAAAARAAERSALEGSELRPSPLAAAISFDVPLLAAGAGPAPDLADTAYAQAYASLREDLSAIDSRSDIDVLNVTWFAGTWSAGSAARFATLLQALATGVPGKQVLLTTGATTAFRTPEDQGQLSSLAFTNLAEHRTSGGVDSPFLGVVFHEATHIASPRPAPAGFDETRAAWTPDVLAPQVLAHWRGETTSDALAYWAAETAGGMALLTATVDAAGAATLAARPGLQALQKIAGIVAEPATNEVVAAAVAATPEPPVVASGEAAPPAEPPVQPPTEGQTPSDLTPPAEATPSPFKEKMKAAAVALLDQLLTRLGEEAGNRLSGGAPAGTEPTSDPLAAPAAVTIVAASCAPASPKVQEKVSCLVNLRNESTSADAAGLSLALLDADDYLLGDETLIEGVALARLAQSTVTIPWYPAAAGTQPVRVKMYDASQAELASASAGQVKVKKGSTKPPKGITPGRFTDLLKPKGAASGLKLARPGFPWIGAFALTGGSYKTMSAEGASFGLPIANPSAQVMPALNAALMVGGTRVATRSVPALRPGQSRRILFERVRLKAGDTHDLRVVLERPGAAPLVAGALRLDRSTPAPLQTSKLASSPARPVLASERTTNLTTRPLETRVPRTPTPAPTSSVGLLRVPTAVPPPARTDFAIAGPIRLSPTAARAGQTVSVQVVVENGGNRPGSPAVLFQLHDGRGAVAHRGNRRLAALPIRGRATADWSFAMPSGGPWRVDVSVQAPDDVNPSNNSTSVTVRGLTVRPPLRRR